jgi:hypothetical protein
MLSDEAREYMRWMRSGSRLTFDKWMARQALIHE